MQIEREVNDFVGVQWEPNHGRFSVQTVAKREVEAGKRDYSMGQLRAGVDLYECYKDKVTGFHVRCLGFHPSEKVVDLKWSPAGEIFALCEKDGMGINAK